MTIFLARRKATDIHGYKINFHKYGEWNFKEKYDIAKRAVTFT